MTAPEERPDFDAMALLPCPFCGEAAEVRIICHTMPREPTRQAVPGRPTAFPPQKVTSNPSQAAGLSAATAPGREHDSAQWRAGAEAMREAVVTYFIQELGWWNESSPMVKWLRELPVSRDAK